MRLGKTSKNQRLGKYVRLMFSRRGWFCIDFLDEIARQCRSIGFTGMVFV